VYCRVLMR